MLQKSRPLPGKATYRKRKRFNFIILMALLGGIVTTPFLVATPANATSLSSLDTELNHFLNTSFNNLNQADSSNYNIYNQNQLSASPSDPTQVNGQQFEYFNSTGHSISGPLLHFYQQSGGQPRHGAPLTEILAVNNHYWQFFQNSVLEFNPLYVGTTSEAKLVPLGQMVAAQNNFPTVAPFANTPDRWYFPESGHSLSAGFLNFWLNNGDRASLGLPLSEEVPSQDAAGQPITYQYFEYVRLEYHSNASDPAQSIQISPLGQQKATELLPVTKLNPIAMNLLTSSRQVRIPSLMIHYIRVVDEKKDPLGFGLSITPDNFVQYLDYLQTHGFHTVTIGQIYDYLRYGVPLPDKPINLRFDDGYVSHWFAYQELQKRGMTATFFVVTRRLELTPQQWQQIDHDGFEVAAHTRTHPDLKGVSDLAGEITGGKTDLEAMLGHPVRTFAFPYGSYSDRVLSVVKSSGFDVAASTDGGVNWNLNKVLVEPTLGITGRDDLNTFIGKAEMTIGGLDAPANDGSTGSTSTTKEVSSNKTYPTPTSVRSIKTYPTATPAKSTKTYPTATPVSVKSTAKVTPPSTTKAAK